MRLHSSVTMNKVLVTKVACATIAAAHADDIRRFTERIAIAFETYDTSRDGLLQVSELLQACLSVLSLSLCFSVCMIMYVCTRGCM